MKPFEMIPDSHYKLHNIVIKHGEKYTYISCGKEEQVTVIAQEPDRYEVKERMKGNYIYFKREDTSELSYTHLVFFIENCPTLANEVLILKQKIMIEHLEAKAKELEDQLVSLPNQIKLWHSLIEEYKKGLDLTTLSHETFDLIENEVVDLE